MSASFTVWFTGLSRSGKSTIAGMLRDRLNHAGHAVELLDSGRIRRELEQRLGFTSEDIEQNLRRISYECQLLNRNGVVAIVVAISPYREQRDRFRQQIRKFVEVYCDAPVDVLVQRDPSGLLAKAQRGELTNVAGIDAPYEAPEHPEIHLRTDELDPAACVDRIWAGLCERQLVSDRTPGAYTAREQNLIKDRLKEMGYQ